MKACANAKKARTTTWTSNRADSVERQPTVQHIWQFSKPQTVYRGKRCKPWLYVATRILWSNVLTNNVITLKAYFLISCCVCFVAAVLLIVLRHLYCRCSLDKSNFSQWIGLCTVTRVTVSAIFHRNTFIIRWHYQDQWNVVTEIGRPRLASYVSRGWCILRHAEVIIGWCPRHDRCAGHHRASRHSWNDVIEHVTTHRVLRGFSRRWQPADWWLHLGR